jgi:hypothetical protein
MFLPGHCLALIASTSSTVLAFSIVSHYYIWLEQKVLCNIGFWQQTLWSLQFSRAPCCLVYCCQCCRRLRIVRNLLHPKCRYQCTRRTYLLTHSWR